jgi:two-component system CheB/CheR fusion protein
LADDTQKVLKTLVFVEKQVTARDGRWFTVRIMPYCTQDNRIDGVVITFADITVAKNLEAALRKAQSDLEKRFTTQTAELGKVRKNLQTGIHQHAKAKPSEERMPATKQITKKPR